MNKIEANISNSIFNDYEIKNEDLANILGGIEITIEIRCNGTDKLSKKEHIEKCSAADTNLYFECSVGATLSGVIAPSVTSQFSHTPSTISAVTFF
ncbi:MAG: hypothetical protein LBV02_08175 [Bacteroidales bacterium]|jgi:hypothetical protein|nr:hypothetical protein [Bacteroidales bacterium]